MVSISEVTNFLRFKSKLLFGALALAFVFGTTFSGVLFSSDRELIYDYDVSVFVCLKDIKNCTYISTLQIANSGEEALIEFTVDIDNLPSSLSSSSRVFNLSAGKPREFDPEYSLVKSNSKTQLNIKRIAPGTLIEIEFSGSIPKEQRKLLSDIMASVSIDADVIEGSPRGTKLARFFSKVLGVFL